MTQRLSDRLRNLAISGESLGQIRTALFALADEVEGYEPIPYRLVVKESGVS